mmetsp:Transcript_22332/g.28984  ORF Transcript_22332/g.28984 Transcript_22332/m.28984 type:complete len:159 (+) Transcript_22332:69-545(+)
MQCFLYIEESLKTISVSGLASMLMESSSGNGYWNFCLDNKLSQEECSQIQDAIQKKLSDLLKVVCDDVLAEYVVVMVGNRKKVKDIAVCLHELVGKEVADQFALWLGETLHKLQKVNEVEEGEVQAKPKKRKKTSQRKRQERKERKEIKKGKSTAHHS